MPFFTIPKQKQRKQMNTITLEGEYVTIVLSESDATIKPTNLAGLCEDFTKHDYLEDVLEDILCNNDIEYFSDIGQIENFFGLNPLTDAPALVFEPVYNEKNDKYTEYNKLYIFEPYATILEIEELIEGREVVFRVV
jgi:hypothetical protein